MYANKHYGVFTSIGTSGKYHFTIWKNKGDAKGWEAIRRDWTGYASYNKAHDAGMQQLVEILKENQDEEMD